MIRNQSQTSGSQTLCAVRHIQVCDLCQSCNKNVFIPSMKRNSSRLCKLWNGGNYYSVIKVCNEALKAAFGSQGVPVADPVIWNSSYVWCKRSQIMWKLVKKINKFTWTRLRKLFSCLETCLKVTDLTEDSCNMMQQPVRGEKINCVVL